MNAPGEANTYPDLPRAITSFGGAVLGGAAYVYGGHFGEAHHYYDEGQSGELLKLDLDAPSGWEVAARGPSLQGLALAAHGGKLYRLGGFEARNRRDEEQDLWSVADCARFDPRTGAWEEVEPMPSPRSSFDAAVAGDTVYVLGGWALRGGEAPVWQETACALELAGGAAAWRELPRPPFTSRALSAGTLGGRVWLIGGMQPEGKVTRRTAVYDPEAEAWGEGPELPGEDMEGFGTACCCAGTSAGERLFVSTSSGKLLRLAEDGGGWEEVGQLREGRFFHRMLPAGSGRLMLLGGANMQRGKFASVETVAVG